MIEYRYAADLHVHTNASDGALPLSEVVDLARARGLEIIAVTDHDSVSGLDQPRKPSAVEVIPGVELSASFEKREAHVLGYFLDHRHEPLVARLSQLRDQRRTRLDAILAKLREHDIRIDAAEVLDAAEGAVGRLHVAEILISQGHAANVYEAFRDFLGTEGKAYVPKPRLSVADAVRMIHDAGGAAVLAHPGNFFVEEEVDLFVAVGLDGVEAHYPSHAPFDTQRWLRFAERHGLVVTGGSDFHGRTAGGTDLGEVRISREDVDILRERSRRYGVRLS